MGQVEVPINASSLELRWFKADGLFHLMLPSRHRNVSFIIAKLQATAISSSIPNMAPKITLYTAHHCPFAHRSQIVLRELGLQFETVLVDIAIPRTPEYLAINPAAWSQPSDTTTSF
jgi:hypothetical protein